MANRYTTVKLNSLQKELNFVYAEVSFGAAGAPSLLVPQSKGVCNVSINSIAFTGTTGNTSTSVTAVTNYAGLYPGMTVTGTGIPASTTISSMNAGAGTLTLSQAATATGTVTITASGGQYLVQFGQQAGVRLDGYYKLLGITHNWSEIGLQGNATTLASAPAAPLMFIVSNNTSIRTIPNTIATNLTDCTVGLQFGNGSGSSFVAAVPANGERVRLEFVFTNSVGV